ncbi:MAG: phage tail tape measure protein [Planctomycetota bacterium]
MARKELVISIRAVDQISRPIRTTMNAIAKLGRRAIATTSRILRSMGGLTKSLLSIKTLLAGVAAGFAAGAIVRSITLVAQALDQTAKSARALGVAVEEYSTLEFVAERAGINVRQLATAYRTAQRNAAQYVRGEGGQAVRAFSDLGAELTDANGRIKQGTDLLEAILVPMSKIQDEAVQTQKLYDIFGRNGPQLKNIGDNMAAIVREADRYGRITESQTRVAESFQDSLTNLGRAWTFLRASVLEAIGPALTRAVNTAAEKMADLGRLTGGIVQAFVATANDPDTRLELGNALSRLLGAASDAMVVGIQAMVRTAGVVIQNSIEPLIILIRNSLGPTISNVIIDTVGEALAKVWDWMGDAGSGPAKNAFSRFFQDLAHDTREGMAYLKEELGDGGELQAAFDDSLTQSLRKSGTNAVRQIDGILNNAFAQLQKIASRDIGGVNVVIDKLIERLKSVKAEAGGIPPAEGVGVWSSFATGVRAAAEAVGEINAQFQKLGTDVFNVVGNQISDGLTSLATGAANARDAFRDMAKGILDDLTRLIIRMAVFNALRTAFGNFGSTTTPDVDPNFVGPPIRTGGVVRPGGHVRRFAMGGVVPGPNINRDMVPAVLAPGEGVVNRRGMRAIGESRLHAINRGEGAGDINLTINVNANGQGQANARAVAEAVKGVVLDLMARNPAFRAQLRDGLA